MKTYRISRQETDLVTYRVNAESVEEALQTLTKWAAGDVASGVCQVGRVLSDVEDEERWVAYPEED